METLFSPNEELEEAKKIVPESTWYRSLCYKTQQSWSRSRRVVPSSGIISPKFVMAVKAQKGVMLLHLYLLQKSLHLYFTLTNIVQEVRWKIELKSNNLICLLTALQHMRSGIL